jgi:hypothetical protein
MIEELEKALHIQIPNNLETEEAREFFVKLCKEKEIECSPPQVRHLSLLLYVWKITCVDLPSSMATHSACDIQVS